MSERGARPRAAIGFSALRGLSRDQMAARLAGPPQEVARWLQAAAKYGVVEAQTALGQILLDGHGIAPDRCAAAGWFKIAADAGYVPAINMLGRCNELGWGIPVDLPRAADCYRRAAEAELDWGQYNFANLLLRGRGVTRDRAAAFRLYCQAAAQGHAKSINMVGRFIEEGWETPADPGAAAEWYRRAAEAGDFRGQYNLASVLAMHGNIAEAETWLHRAMLDATADFLTLMSQRLATAAEPRLRDISAIAARFAAAKALSTSKARAHL
jgi:TPR repeat protein